MVASAASFKVIPFKTFGLFKWTNELILIEDPNRFSIINYIYIYNHIFTKENILKLYFEIIFYNYILNKYFHENTEF